jgi:amino acid transporter
MLTDGNVSCVDLITAVNCYSVKLTLRVQNVFTVAKLTAIGVIICCGIYQLATGNTQHLATGFQGSVYTFGSIATAFYGGLYTYDGWYDLNLICFTKR